MSGIMDSYSGHYMGVQLIVLDTTQGDESCYGYESMGRLVTTDGLL